MAGLNVHEQVDVQLECAYCRGKAAVPMTDYFQAHPELQPAVFSRHAPMAAVLESARRVQWDLVMPTHTDTAAIRCRACKEAGITDLEHGLAARITTAVAAKFRTFGTGGGGDLSPLSAALKDDPPMFAAGVDVAEVVLFVLKAAKE